MPTFLLPRLAIMHRSSTLRWLMPVVVLCLVLAARAEPPGSAPMTTPEIRLLVRGDDMGSCHAANTACIACFRNGLLRSVEVMVPGPWFLEAAALLAENPELDVGIHLTLTSEWDHLKWRPLTTAPGLVDADGYFFPNLGEPGRPGSGLLGAADTAAVERELRAQIEMARRHIRNVTHLSTHMFGPGSSPLLRAVLEKLAAEYRLPLAPKFPEVGSLGEWPKATAEQKEAAFAGHLEQLPPGTWFLLTHPGSGDPEMWAMYVTPWYPNVAADRLGDAWILTSPRIREIVARRGIRAVGYGDVLREGAEPPRP